MVNYCCCYGCKDKFVKGRATTFHSGFQKQIYNKGEVNSLDPFTICGLLEIALKGCEPENFPTVVPSSRTDKGVHAICNTAHVDLKENKTLFTAHSITAQLNRFFQYNDHDIRILKAQQVADDFHSRYKAIGRRYLYRVAVPKASLPFKERLVIPSPLTELNRCFFLQHPEFDYEAIKSACDIFIGEKDFKAVSSRTKSRIPIEKSTIKTITDLQLIKTTPFLPTPGVCEGYDFYHFICSGRSFLYHQVRRIVSALLMYGQGKVSLSDVQRLVDEPVEESWKPFQVISPPQGLYLLEVQYNVEDLTFSHVESNEKEIEELTTELHQVLQSLDNFERSVNEKINLKQRVLEIKKRRNQLLQRT